MICVLENLSLKNITSLHEDNLNSRGKMPQGMVSWGQMKKAFIYRTSCRSPKRQYPQSRHLAFN